jgi:16S rRNA (adenine1518-N6/adenine1519-N6)-dimethyltransferase
MIARGGGSAGSWPPPEGLSALASSDSLRRVPTPRPRLHKGLGQHHLTSGALTRPLIAYLAPAGRRVIEIGPGGGVLTSELLAAGARVTAWEIDLGWTWELRRRLRGSPLALAAADALDLQWSRLRQPALVAGNLPYNVATAIVERLLPHHRQVPRAAFLVQREVAERLVARAGDAAYGSLSVLVAAYSRPRLLGRVRRGSFRPPPKVEGAFVGLELMAPPLPEPEMGAFVAMVRGAFGQRRKMLHNSLGAMWGRGPAAAALAEVGLPGGVRAEQVALAQWLEIYRRRPGGGGGGTDR